MGGNCLREGWDQILGKISLRKEWSGIGTGCPGQWGSHHPWRRSKTVQIRHLRTWFSGGLGSVRTVGLDDLRGLVQPKWLCDFILQSRWCPWCAASSLHNVWWRVTAPFHDAELCLSVSQSLSWDYQIPAELKWCGLYCLCLPLT